MYYDFSNRADSSQLSVHIVLVNYNDIAFIEKCIHSIYFQSYNNITLHVIDNQSSDGSLNVIRQYRGIDLVCLPDNIGWGAASNIGIRCSIEQGADYVLLLNTDTFCLPNMLDNLICYAEDYSILSPRIANGFPADINHIDFDSYSMWYEGGAFTGEAYVDQHYCAGLSEVSEVDFISGCCMLISKTVFERVGYFDESFFLYSEDSDYCIRAKQAGVKMKYVPSSKLFHYGNGCLGGEVNATGIYYSLRNRLYLAQKHHLFLGFEQIIKDFLSEKGELRSKCFSLVITQAVFDYFRGNFGKRILWQDEADYSRDLTAVINRKQSHLKSLHFDIHTDYAFETVYRVIDDILSSVESRTDFNLLSNYRKVLVMKSFGDKDVSHILDHLQQYVSPEKIWVYGHSFREYLPPLIMPEHVITSKNGLFSGNVDDLLAMNQDFDCLVFVNFHLMKSDQLPEARVADIISTHFNCDTFSYSLDDNSLNHYSDIGKFWNGVEILRAIVNAGILNPEGFFSC